MLKSRLQTLVARALKPPKGLDYEKFLHEFQQTLNLRNFKQVKDTEFSELFRSIWTVLLETSANPSSTVRLAAQRVAGVFLTRITPYFPNFVLGSFSDVARSASSFDVKSLIVVASAFAYLSSMFVPRQRLPIFIKETPVCEHFSCTDPVFAEHLVAIIGNLGRLGTPWLETMLDQFLEKFKSDESRFIIKVIAAIVAHQPDVFFARVFEKVDPETPGFYSLMSFLLSSNDGKLDKVDLMPLAKLAVKTLAREDACPADLDSALQILAVKSESFNVDVVHTSENVFHIKVWNADGAAEADLDAKRVDGRPAFYLIKLPIEFLNPKESDSLLIRNAKFKSLAQNEALDVGDVYRVYEPYMLREYGDDTAGAIQGLQYCVNRFLTGVPADKIIASLQRVLFTETASWFHALDIVKIVEALDSRAFTEIMGHGCFSQLVQVVVGICFCENSSLSKDSIHTLGRLTTRRNFAKVVDVVVDQTNYFEPRPLTQSLSILTMLLKRINERTESLEMFATRVFEAASCYSDNLDVLAKIFDFLRLYRPVSLPVSELEDLATAVVYCSLASVTGNPIEQLTKEKTAEVMMEIVAKDLGSRNVDIITSPSNNYNEFIRPMRQALRFLFSLESDCIEIAMYSFVLLPLECSQYFMKKWQSIPVERQKAILRLGSNHVRYIGDDDVAGIWCKLAKDQDMANYGALHTFLIETSVYSLQNGVGLKWRSEFESYLLSQNDIVQSEVKKLLVSITSPQPKLPPSSTEDETVVESAAEDGLPANVEDNQIQTLFEQHVRDANVPLVTAILKLSNERKVNISISGLYFPPAVVPTVSEHLAQTQPDIVTQDWALEHLRTPWRSLALASIKRDPSGVLNRLVTEPKLSKSLIMSLTSIVADIDFCKTTLLRLATQLVWESKSVHRFQATLRFLAAVVTQETELEETFMSDLIKNIEPKIEDLDCYSISIIALAFAAKQAPDKEFIAFVTKLLPICGPNSPASVKLHQILIRGSPVSQTNALIKRYIKSVIPSRYRNGLRLLDIHVRATTDVSSNLKHLVIRFAQMSWYPFTAELQLRVVMSVLEKEPSDHLQAFLFSVMPLRFQLQSGHAAYTVAIKLWPLVIEKLSVSSPHMVRIMPVVDALLASNQGFHVGMVCLSKKLGKMPQESRADALVESLKAWVDAVAVHIDYSIYSQVREWIDLAWETEKKSVSRVVCELLRVRYLLPVFVNIAVGLELRKENPDFAADVEAAAMSCEGKVKDALVEMIRGTRSVDAIVKLWSDVCHANLS